MSPSLNTILTPQDIERIHKHSLDLLERVGIDYKTPKALQVLEEMGCPVDYELNHARLPREVVEWALRQAPRVVRLEARDPARDVVLDGQTSHHTTDSQGTEAIDLESGERHDSTAEDLRRVCRFGDALDMVEIVNVTISASDVPAHLRTIFHFTEAFTNTSKHVRTGILNADQVPLIVELAKTATGSEEFRPIFSVVDCTISPLMHDHLMTEACIELARLRVPIMVYPMPLAGGTSPVTLGGTILLHNVEFLSGLVLFQAVNPGTPVIYGAGASQLDMHTGRYGGSADGAGMQMALCELAHFYNVPVNLFGLSTKSHTLNAQYGYEAIANNILARLAGADEIYSMGLLGASQVLSLEKMVMDNHLARLVEEMLQPVKVDEEHLQAELIERVGIGGSFLTQRETRDFTRREYVPMWPPAGQDVLKIARAEALDILHNHKPPPLPDGASEKMEAILADADVRLRDI
ncbi:MAG TPA: trimethylamine methyltransferase family protein [candidate division Zixibacteria bacterium]|nr:trimethylamine methyltransferase family protein [candidate division Zixibacteria bacterium]